MNEISCKTGLFSINEWFMIPERALQLLDKDGFIKAYYEGIRAGQGCKESFEAVNQEYYMFFKKYRYLDYKNFAKVRDYKQKQFRKQGKKFARDFLFKP